MQQSNPPYIRSITILHLALLVGQLLLGIIIVSLVYFKNASYFSLQGISQQLLIACLLFSVVAYFAGNNLFKKKLEQINEEYNPVSQKLNDYRAANILRWAMMEGAVMFCIIIFFATGNYLIILIAGVMMLLFLSTRPTLLKTIRDLDISEAELEQNNEPGL